jgi:hypothetical protein
MSMRETGLKRYVLLPVQGKPYQWRELNQQLEDLVTGQKDWSLSRDVVTFFFPHTPDFMKANQEGCLIGRELIGPPKDIVEPFVALDWTNQELEFYEVNPKSWNELFEQVQVLWESRAVQMKSGSRWIFEWQRELKANELGLIGQVAFYS